MRDALHLIAACSATLALAGCGSTKAVGHGAAPSGVSAECRRSADANPALTASQIATAKRVLAADSRFARIVAAAGTDVPAVMPSVGANSWTNNDGSILLGASMFVQLPAKTSITTTWPVMKYDQSERSCPPYTTGTLHFTASKVTGLMVTVDLTRRLVVEIQPDQNAVISNLQPNVPTTQPPGASQ